MKQISLHLEGQRYGKLTVIKEEEPLYSNSNKMIRRWLCLCDCGKTTVVRHGDIRNGRTLSCGCYNFEKESKAKIHGYSRTKLGRVFEAMKQRCNNPNNKNYRDYGGRGIKVCNEWLENQSSFYEWSINNGYKEGLTIDRIDVNGNYEPSNCRWTNQETQCVNQRVRKDNKTGCKNIHISNGKYVVQITRNKKKKYYGSYNTLEEAIEAKKKIEKQIDFSGGMNNGNL